MLGNKKTIQLISRLLILSLFATSSLAYSSSWGGSSSFRRFEADSKKQCRAIAVVFSVVAAVAIVGVSIYFGTQGENATALSTRVALTKCEWQNAKTRADRFSELLSAHNCSDSTDTNETLPFGTISLCALFQERWETNQKKATQLQQAYLALEAQQN